MKFKDSIFDPASGESFAVVTHRGKDYSGKAKAHPDEEFISQYFGCDIALYRATLKALKEEYRDKKAACEECRKFVKAITQYKNFDKNSASAKAMYRQLNKRIKEVNKIGDDITKIELNIRASIRKRAMIDEKLKNKND